MFFNTKENGMNNFTNSIHQYFLNLKNTIDVLDFEKLNAFLNKLLEIHKHDKCIYVMGNGGSAFTSSHFVCDFVKGVSHGLDKKFKMVSLSDNIGVLTAYANDICYDNIFVEQLKNSLKPDDMVIGISGSGNSKNVINAINYAKKIGAFTAGLCGYDGGKLKKKVDLFLHAKIKDMQISEDIHAVICHMAMKIIFNHLRQ